MSDVTGVMIGNALISAGWLAAFCYMIYLGNDWWAAACIFGALFSGFSFKEKT